MTTLDWQSDALCATTDPEAFFPEDGRATQTAKTICGMCTVTETCLKYAVDNEFIEGFWGGKTERQRRMMRAETRDA